MANVLKGYYENHLHLFYTCRKHLRRKGIDYEEFEQELFDAAIFIYNYTMKNLDIIGKKKLRLPTSVFTYRLNGCEDIGEAYNVIITAKDIISTYDNLLEKEEAELLKNVECIKSYLDISRMYLRPSEKESGFLKTLPNGKKNYYRFSNELLDEAERLIDKSGVYFLYDDNEELIYIGKSYDLGRRILTSTRERHASYYSYSIINNKCDTDIYEIYYIGLLNPPLNSANKNEDIPTVKLKELNITPCKPTYGEEYIPERKQNMNIISR